MCHCHSHYNVNETTNCICRAREFRLLLTCKQALPQVIEQAQKERLAYISHINHGKKALRCLQTTSEGCTIYSEDSVVVCASFANSSSYCGCPWLPIVFEAAGFVWGQGILPRTLVGKNTNHTTNPTDKAKVKFFSKDLCLSTMLVGCCPCECPAGNSVLVTGNR